MPDYNLKSYQHIFAVKKSVSGSPENYTFAIQLKNLKILDSFYMALLLCVSNLTITAKNIKHIDVYDSTLKPFIKLPMVVERLYMKLLSNLE